MLAHRIVLPSVPNFQVFFSLTSSFCLPPGLQDPHLVVVLPPFPATLSPSKPSPPTPYFQPPTPPMLAGRLLAPLGNTQVITFTASSGVFGAGAGFNFTASAGPTSVSGLVEVLPNRAPPRGGCRLCSHRCSQSWRSSYLGRSRAGRGDKHKKPFF